MSRKPHNEVFEQKDAPRTGGHASAKETVVPGATPSPAPQTSAPGSFRHTNGGLPPEVRAIGVILAVDFLVGIWLAIHTSGAIAAYLAPQVPVVGLGALAWGFLPDEPKKAFGAWLASRLAAPLVFWLVLLCGMAGLGVSLFVSTIIIESVESGITTNLHVLRGTPACTDVTPSTASDELRLNRLTTPQRKHMVISPFGTRVWLYTPTHVSMTNPKVLPWIPVRLQYPDDFEQMVTIEVLPDDSTLSILSHDDIHLSLMTTDGSGTIVAQDILHEGSARVAYTEPPAVGRDTIRHWRKILEKINPDVDFVNPMIDAWQKSSWVRACYPLQVDQELLYKVYSDSGETLKKGRLQLTNVITRFHLSL